MTVARKAMQRINDIIVRHLFPGRPISNIPRASNADVNAIFPHKQMSVIHSLHISCSTNLWCSLRLILHPCMHAMSPFTGY